MLTNFYDIANAFNVPDELSEAPEAIKAYLKALALHGNESAAIRVSGITRKDLNFWRTQSSVFRQAEQQAREWHADALEFEAKQRVLSDVTDKRDKLLIKILEAEKPDKYSNRMQISGSGVQLVLPDFMLGTNASDGDTDDRPE